MRESGPTRLLVYRGDSKCAHSVVIGTDRWPDAVRLSKLEPLFVCYGHRGADARPLCEQWARAPKYPSNEKPGERAGRSKVS